MVLACLAACHKDKEMDVKEAVVSNEEMTVSETQARFSWQVDFAGQFQTGVEVSQNENMADLRRVEASKEEDKFVAVVDSLAEGKKYYYRIVVWNKFGSYEETVKDFTTAKTFSIHVEASEGGTATGGGTFAEGDTCTVIATANMGYNFVNWTENGSQVSADAEYSFAVTGNRSLVANFTSQEYTITATAEPEEGGTVDGFGGYNNGDECTLRATANEGYEFLNWTKEDGTIVSTDPVYAFTVTETAAFVAHFQAIIYTISASAYPENGGTVTGGGDDFHYGDECSLTATAASGYRFVNWTKDDTVVHGEPTYSFPVTESGEYVAHFEEIAFDLVVSAQPTVIAQGGSSQLKAEASGGTGSFSYSWTPNASLNDASIHNPIASPTTTTTYTCTVTSGGQTGSGSCTVKVVCPPTDVTATVQNTNNVHLNWTAANPAESYNVYRNDTLIGQGVTNRNFDDNGLSSGTYHYRVSAVYQGVESPKSNDASVTIYNSLSVTASANPVTIPDGGSSTLTATAIGGDGNYTYSWTPSTGLNNTHIQSPTATPSSTTTYTVTVESNGQTASDDVTVNVVKAPTNLTATVQNTNNVHLSWNATTPADSYKVYRDNTMIAQNITATSYDDNNLNWGTTYNYQVSTVYLGVESPKSNTAQAVIPPQVPEGAIPGKFTIDGNGNKVYFSKGNLQYIGSASTPYWKFADNQWDYLGDNGQGSTNQNVDRDLFGWGTSGYNHGAVCYQPWSTSEEESDYYAYGNYIYSLYHQTGQADWGYNSINNGGNTINLWRTLSNLEWVYVFDTRSTLSGIRYAKAKVNNVNGVILLPDDWSTNYYSLYSTDTPSASFTRNTITASQWSTLEQHGAVFLPAAGTRGGTSIGNEGSYGRYWSASRHYEPPHYISNCADCIYFLDTNIGTTGFVYNSAGGSVRLVCPAEN